MSSNEINSGNGLETGVEPSTGLSGGMFDINRDLFGQPLSKAPSALGSIPNSLLEFDENSLNVGATHDSNIDSVETQAYSDVFTPVYGDEFESGIPPIDFTARQVGKVLDVFEKTVENNTPAVRQFIRETTAQLSDAIHEGVDTARENWNAPDNELRQTLSDRIQRGVGFLKKWAATLSENPDARELIDNAITVGRNLAEKTGDVIQNTQVAVESWLNRAYNEIYSGDLLSPGQSIGNDRSAHPFVGVIDTDFNALGHGTQIIEAIQRVGHQFPDWLADSVGRGTWSESLVNFVDAAKASKHFNAVINLSFDLTQINPDGSVSTRFELTTMEREALKYAQANGVLVVVSAGNQGGAMSALGQASQDFDNVIAVGATEGGQRASYSSYGAGLDFVTSGQGKVDVEGTSLAAARMTGSIARIWDANPQLDYRQVIQTLESTAIDLQKPGWDSETGFGRLNTPAAIAWAEDFAAQPQSRSTQALPVVAKDPGRDLHNGTVKQGSVWRSNGAIATERSNRLIEGDGTKNTSAKSEPSPAPPSKPSKYQGMSPDAAERWIEAEQKRERERAPSKYQGMSPDAAERWIENAAAPDPIAPPVPTLMKYRRGTSLTYNPAVAQWQQRMKDQGYSITVDGLYGSQSEQVARQFQKDQGLTVDGIVGPDTWNASLSRVHRHDLTQSSTSDVPRTPDAAEIWLADPNDRRKILEHRSRGFADPSVQPSDVPKTPDAAEIWLARPDQKEELLQRRAGVFPNAKETTQSLTQSIVEMSHPDRMAEAFERSLPMLGDEVEATLRELIDPENLPQLIQDFMIETGLSAIPVVGWFMKGQDAYELGKALWDAGGYLWDFYKTTERAETEVDLDTAAQHLTNAVLAVGVETLAEVLLGRSVGDRISDDPSTSNQSTNNQPDESSSPLDSDSNPVTTPPSNETPTVTEPTVPINSGSTNSGSTPERSNNQNTDNGSSAPDRPNNLGDFRSFNDETRASLHGSGAKPSSRDSSSRLDDAAPERSPTPGSITRSTPSPRSDIGRNEVSLTPAIADRSSGRTDVSDSSAIESSPNREPTASPSPELSSNTSEIESSSSPEFRSNTSPSGAEAGANDDAIAATAPNHDSAAATDLPNGFMRADANDIGKRIRESHARGERSPLERFVEYNSATGQFKFKPHLGIDKLTIHANRDVVWRPDGETGDTWISTYRERDGVTTEASKSERDTFRRHVSERIGAIIAESRRTGIEHPFERLGNYNEATEEFTLRSNLHAGHTTTAGNGRPNRFAIEIGGVNSRDGRTREKTEILRKRAIEIDGIPFVLQTARELFSDHPDLIEGAQSNPGWNRDVRLVDGRVEIFNQSTRRWEPPKSS
jgi:hypothetical protein